MDSWVQRNASLILTRVVAEPWYFCEQGRGILVVDKKDRVVTFFLYIYRK